MRLYLLLIVLFPALFGSRLFAEDFRLTRPTAVVVDQDQQLAWVANRNGHLSSVDLAQQQIIGDHAIGEELSDLVRIPGQPELLAADPAGRELILLTAKGEVLRRVRLPLPPDRLALSQDGKTVCLSSITGPAVCIVGLTEQPEEDRLPLPVPVRNVLALPDGRFLAADRFGGHLFVIDAAAKSVIASHDFRAHQIRGLVLDQTGENVLVTHQILSRLSQSSYEDIHWGMLMQNVISRIPLVSLLDDDADLNRARKLIHVGDTGGAAADPSDIILLGAGYIVAASGADKLFVRIHPDVRQQPVHTQSRPTRLVRIDNRHVLVLNEFADTLQIVRQSSNNVAQWEVETTIGTPRSERSAAERGEHLFYSAELTHDRWFSCNSCHVDGHSPDLFADTLGDGTYGNPKRIPSLLGVSHTGPWGWNGSFPTLEDQIRKSLDTTMHGGIDDDDTVNDLAAFLETLSAPEAEEDAGTAPGRDLFASLNCTRCHQPPVYTSPKTYDIGLTDETGLTEFNPPSLRGLSRRRTFLHDGRAETLEDAIRQHAGDADSSRDAFEKLSAEDRKSLLEFLRGL